eukprot:482415_1
MAIIPSTINQLILKYYLIPTRSSHSIILSKSAISLYDIQHGTKQTIQIINDSSTQFINDSYQPSIGCCFIPNIETLPPYLNNDKYCNHSALYQFNTTLKCIVFNMNNTKQIIEGYVTKFKNPFGNNDYGFDDMKRHQRMIYNQTRNSILIAGGSGASFESYDELQHIAEFNLYTRDVSMIGKFSELRQIYPNLCMIDDNKLLICGGRNYICMQDSFCTCTALCSVDILNLNEEIKNDMIKECVTVSPMNEKREGHGLCFIKELQKVAVCGGKGGNLSLCTMEIYDINKDQWIQIENKCKYQYRFGNVFCFENNPFVISVFGFSETVDRNLHCEYIDIRDNKQTWMISRFDSKLIEEKDVVQVLQGSV